MVSFTLFSASCHFSPNYVEQIDEASCILADNKQKKLIKASSVENKVFLFRAHIYANMHYTRLLYVKWLTF